MKRFTSNECKRGSQCPSNRNPHLKQTELEVLRGIISYVFYQGIQFPESRLQLIGNLFVIHKGSYKPFSPV